MDLPKLRNIVEDYLLSIPNDHPLQISLRTYSLALSLSLTPSVLPFLTSPKGYARLGGAEGLKRVLKRELGLAGFAFAITVAIGGGAALQRLWSLVDESEARSTDRKENFSRLHCLLDGLRKYSSSLKLSSSQKAFLSNAVTSMTAIILLQARRRSSHQAPIPLTPPMNPPSRLSTSKPSPTLDLTLLFLVRALDALVQATIFKRSQSKYGHGEPYEGKQKEHRNRWTTRVDAMLFWSCSARIMWCFFYEPKRLPRSYVKWITSLANVDPRVLQALRDIRSGTFSYVRKTVPPGASLSAFSRELGYPSSWGNPARVPAYSGSNASEAWQSLGYTGRHGVAGIPCELVHGGGSGCLWNAMKRGAIGFGEAFVLYLPVHFLPVLLTRPRSLLRLSTLLARLLSTVRSATFLSSFISSIWLVVCLTRTLVLPQVLHALHQTCPILITKVSHDFFDGPYGCILAGSLACGSSIWIEEGRRRGEIMLYVLPRAVRTFLNDRWVKSGNRSTVIAERLTFGLSLAALLTAATHRPESLRGLSRWTLSFIMKGPDAVFWKRRASHTRGRTQEGHRAHAKSSTA